MQTKANKRMSTETLVLAALMTALVVILQFMGSFVRLGPFQCSLVLMPIVVGAAMCGPKVSAWLGFVFGMVVLLNGDAAAFLTVNAIGTVITVLAKGTLCGLCAGLVYNLLKEKNKYLAVFAAAIVCPIVNTGVFLIGCFLFFFKTVEAWGLAMGFENAIEYMFIGLVGANFLFEMITNIVLCPAIVRVLNLRKTK
ncbi:MAG: ECF transporter S component [Clostridia bacterium]|nr:ECF transporter S component [Clostridia bacterium]